MEDNNKDKIQVLIDTIMTKVPFINKENIQIVTLIQKVDRVNEFYDWIVNGHFELEKSSMFYCEKGGNIDLNKNFMSEMIRLYDNSKLLKKTEFNLKEKTRILLSYKNEIILKYQLKDVNLSLDAGFKKRKCYFLYGNYLSGKTTFIKNLILFNLENIKESQSKILIIDTNRQYDLLIDSFCFSEEYSKYLEKIDILSMRNENEIFQFLRYLIEKNKSEYSFIIIDFLYFNDNYSQNEFHNLVKILNNSKNLGIIAVIFEKINDKIKNITFFDMNFTVLFEDYKLLFFSEGFPDPFRKKQKRLLRIISSKENTNYKEIEL